ncbi:DUF2516 family protein [Nonomuraea gerenzanensis]|uniref:Integral membrane protein n=1 Tax=Nonomuraea gerenzanensis TaxID=93944 RepID=A0A1M4DZC0_9ACTN|nr:DUF2516 family protein [Nonomuraea gerenzanensis]UBU14201.1 DUF2516 family protein [Nonomuraea gerenzanensis]SBO91894.1 hypothetical protein BN4615_P1408 [Nonomuraea gerenzanensis]
MDMINGVFNLLFLVLAVAILGMSIYALVHALRVPANAFVSAGKLQKNLWLLILGLATLFSAAGALSYFQAFMVVGGAQFIGIGLGLFSIAAVIAATIYIVDVKPAVKGMGGRGGNNGPYGPW